MFDKMKQIMEMKKQAQQIKRELDTTNVESTDVQGIKVVINGSQNFQAIEIDENILGVDNKQKLETDLLRSVNAAIKKSQNLAAQRMKSVLSGFPGL